SSYVISRSLRVLKGWKKGTEWIKMVELNKFLATREFPGKLLFAKVWGSRSHNTDKPDSDWDFSGVYVAPTKDFLGLTPPPETTQNKEGQEKPDYSFHEVGKFC